MNFFIAFVEFADHSERRYATRKSISLGIFIDFNQNRPVFSLAMLLTRAFPASRLRDIEYEQPARLQSGVCPTKEPSEFSNTVALVEQIVEALAE